MQANSAAATITDLKGSHTEPEGSTPAEAEVLENRQRRIPENPNAVTLSADSAQTWLAWQCRMVAGIIRGHLYLYAGREKPGALVATWP